MSRLIRGGVGGSPMRERMRVRRRVVEERAAPVMVMEVIKLDDEEAEWVAARAMDPAAMAAEKSKVCQARMAE